MSRRWSQNLIWSFGVLGTIIVLALNDVPTLVVVSLIALLPRQGIEPRKTPRQG
jgi:hypothetical protein